MLFWATAVVASPAPAVEIEAAAVRRAIDRGVSFLESKQNGDGSWTLSGPGGFKAGMTALVTLALLESGRTSDDESVAAGLRVLRNIREPEPSFTYEAALTIMALAAAKEPRRDFPRITALADRLERSAGRAGNAKGAWHYQSNGTPVSAFDHSNSQYAVLGLLAATYAGVEVEPKTWQAIRDHWVDVQNGNGSWGYQSGGGQTGSMTVAGIATLSIVRRFLREDVLDASGAPDCCSPDEDEELAEALARAERWMGRRFSVSSNPGAGGWLLYYLYGLERGGRLTGRRFFGVHDWYREGARFLTQKQSVRDGSWRGVATEQDPVLGTAFCLLFLSKGLAPVLVNKLKTDDLDEAGVGWNRHPDDARNLTEFVTTLPEWPRLVTWQVLDLPKAAESGTVGDLLQAPVLYIIDNDLPEFGERELKLLREYIDSGGFIFTVAACGEEAFGRDVEALARKLFPGEDLALRPLGPDHPVYRAEYLLDPAAAPLSGIDVGCRTALIHSPDDLGCLWDRWLPADPIDRDPQLLGRITQKMRVGVNVLAYATGREPPAKLDVDVTPDADDIDDPVERGLLQVAVLKHAGGWDIAPRAVRNLLREVNKDAGLVASTRRYAVAATDEDLFQFPLVYMHGRDDFVMAEADRDALRTYIERGGVILADACCGSTAFDRSFRDFVKELEIGPLERLPTAHPLLTRSFGYDLSKVSRRTVAGGADAPLEAANVVGPAALEAVTLDGRLAVIYSRYDLSCALEKQSSAACAGYLPDDALKIAVNLVLYTLLSP
ncbi:MAG: DUF4159 domain-containing protein [Planctomycetota bacterium]